MDFISVIFYCCRMYTQSVQDLLSPNVKNNETDLQDSIEILMHPLQKFYEMFPRYHIHSDACSMLQSINRSCRKKANHFPTGNTMSPRFCIHRNIFSRFDDITLCSVIESAEDIVMQRNISPGCFGNFEAYYFFVNCIQMCATWIQMCATWIQMCATYVHTFIYVSFMPLFIILYPSIFLSVNSSSCIFTILSCLRV